MKPGSKNHAPFSTSRASYGAYFVEPVVAQQGRYIIGAFQNVSFYTQALESLTLPVEFFTNKW